MMARLWSARRVPGNHLATELLLAADAPPVPAEADKSPVAAVVNGRKIRTSEVESLSRIGDSRIAAGHARRPIARRVAGGNAGPVDRSAVGRGGVDRQQSAQPSTKDVDAAIENTRLQLESQHKSLDDLLTQRHLTLSQLRDQYAWQVLWERAVAKYLTDKILQEYFDSHRRQYDGSEVRASHILLRPAGRFDVTAANTLVEEAAALRAQIEAGKLTFAEAAEKYSAGPSRETGGRRRLFLPPWCDGRSLFASRFRPGKRPNQPAGRNPLWRASDHGDRRQAGHKRPGPTWPTN